jgi:hypothetical protein
MSQGLTFFGGIVIYDLKHSFNPSLHLPYADFIIQIMRSEMVFQAINNHIGFL